ncbi:MAG: restriction endonuclease subunit S [Roseomonas sp.]|nr:restriction endonuclease subunit S [Roseomonas sp.]
MSVAPYPEYRSSPLTPTGVAPKHWLDGAVKRGFRITLGKMVVASNENDDRTTQPYLRSANVQDGWLALDDVKEMYFSPTEAASLSLLEGDLVICEGGDVGRCALLRENLEGYGFQNSINRARGIGDNCTAYLAYWLSHLKNNGFIDVLCNRSTIAHYTAEKLANTPMLMPTPEEQSTIAAFLDQETGKIDALVAEQERLIALLKEKRQAVISRAVTKGLNPNAPMKDSGIEWLGQVPAHWRVGKAGFYLDVLSGFAFPSEGFSEDEQATRLLRGINVSVGEIRWDDVVYWHRRPDDQLERYLLRQGDLVIGMDRPWIAAGVRVARLGGNDTPCLLLQRVARLSVNSKLNDEYLYSLLASDFFIAHFSPDMTGVSVPHISRLLKSRH